MIIINLLGDNHGFSAAHNWRRRFRCSPLSGLRHLCRDYWLHRRLVDSHPDMIFVKALHDWSFWGQNFTQKSACIATKANLWQNSVKATKCQLNYTECANVWGNTRYGKIFTQYLHILCKYLPILYICIYCVYMLYVGRYLPIHVNIG